MRNKAILVAILVALTLACLPGECGVIRVKPGGVDLNDGSSWALARKTITRALTDAKSGDEIWVAAGTYAENITLKAGVALYGGFASIESARDARDWRSNLTVIDGAAKGSVITAPSGVTTSARVDGFVIRNGLASPAIVSGETRHIGGGICCVDSSPTIVNNSIRQNISAHFGGAIYCRNGSPVITNNVISGNSAAWNGAAIYLTNSSPQISNNVIASNTISSTGYSGNEGGGIYCGGTSAPAITNNTIVANTVIQGGGGICCDTGTTPLITNNIVESNSTGIFSVGNPALHCNCVHGQGSSDYVNVEAGTGDISFVPVFVDEAAGNYHLQATSKCIGAGEDSVVQAGWLDMDGQTRKYGTRVDIGADEFWPPPTVAISQPTPGQTYTTVSTALAMEGTASEGVVSVTWANDRGMSGKCSGTTAWSASAVELLTGQNTITVTASDAAGFTAVDVLTVTCTAPGANAIRVKPSGNDANSGLTWDLAKRTIKDAIADAESGQEIWVAAGTYYENITLKDGVGVYGGFAATEAARNERRAARNVTTIDGRHLDNTVQAPKNTTDTAVIDGFTIRGGTGDYGGGIYCLESSATISNNTITSNSITSGNGGGIYCAGGAVGIINNVIYANNAGDGRGGGIYCYGCGRNTTIVSNTIVSNVAGDGAGLYFYNCSSGIEVANNIVAFNNAEGIASYGYGFKPTLTSNDFYGNSGEDYAGTLEAGATDISLDPRFIDAAGANYHLSTASPASPCIDVGWSLAPYMTDLDVDGQRRINSVVDIGADETWPNASVAITSPTADPAYLSTSTTLAIGGTASDGVLNVAWANDRGGSGSCSGTTTWSASGIALATGANVITVTADAAVTTAVVTLSVFCDSAPPSISITSPTDEATYTTSVALLSIGGAASDDTGISTVTWSSDRGGAGSCAGTGSWSASGIQLLPGDNVISVTATDVAGRQTSAKLRVTFTDATPPTVKITSPTASPTYSTKTDTLTLSGTASDDVAISLIGWANDRGGTGVCTGAGTWTTGNVALSAGANVITVTAADVSGNTSTDVITITYDGQKPEVSITSPSSTGTYESNVSSVDLAGSASDNIGVAQVAWSVAGGGHGLCDGTTSWHLNGLQLRPGMNRITITAADAAGNTASATITVTFTDVTPPSCTIAGPTDEAYYSTHTGKVAINGTSSDDAGVADVAWSNDRGGSGACTGTATWSAADIVLKPGMNTITVTARDTAGNSGFDIIYVTFTDDTPPTVQITSPTSSDHFTRLCDTAVLGGTASDDVGVTTVYWWSDRGGTGSCTGTSTWTATGIGLQPGVNVVTVVASDSSDNAGQASVTITTSDDAPGDAWKGQAMVSLPLVPDSSDPAQVVDFYQNDWLMYWPVTGSYARYPSTYTWFEPTRSAPGRGFWARFVGTVAPPCGSAVDQDKPAEIGLFEGWNLIGQPFLKPVEWDLDAIQIRTPGADPTPLRTATSAVLTYAWGYDNTLGNYYLIYDPAIVPGAVSQLDPWRAYWIKAKTDCTLILPAP